MLRRNKTKFEKWFSFSRHKRRFGAKELSSQISTDFSKQKQTIITGDKIKYTHGSFHDLKEHIHALRYEFIGQSELCYTHAKIIVLIRRNFNTKKHFAIFEQLWHEEKKHLLKNLNIRWLISASDTFTDHSSDNTIRALSLACSCLFNTVRMQEGERYITDIKNQQDNQNKIKELQNKRVPLFNGTSMFVTGLDDSPRNMRWRIDKMAKINIAGEILLEIFLRLQKFDTVYKRFKDKHTRDKTAWW